MKRITDRERMTVGDIALALLAGAVMAVCFWVVLCAALPPSPDRGGLADREEVRLMAYHGVGVAWVENGQLYALRDGRKFRLWDPREAKR